MLCDREAKVGADWASMYERAVNVEIELLSDGHTQNDAHNYEVSRHGEDVGGRAVMA